MSDDYQRNHPSRIIIMNSSISDLLSKGIVRVEYPPRVRNLIIEAVEAWKVFCALPLELKQSLPYSDPSTGVGYENKDGSGPRGDKKENFDFALRGAEWLSRNRDSLPPEALAFLDKAERAVIAVRDIIHTFAADVETRYGLKDFYNEVVDSDELFFIRFIHYQGNREIGEETATAHVDQSGFTLHLYESAPGFQCLTYDDKQWQDVAFDGTDTVIIPSMQMQLCSNNAIKAMCHRVVATAETANTGRYSAVCFVQLRWTRKYNKDMFGRLQERAPGFNYGMSEQAFANMFK